jgi:lipopolysaccharide transport system permease protein
MRVSKNTELEGWTKVITTDRGWWDLRMGQLWKYRDLITVFMHRNMVATYKQTVLGPLWFFVQPLITTVVFTVIFKKIARIPTDSIPPFLFYMSGIVAWNYFQECLLKTGTTFSANSGLFGKVYFPRLTVPLSVVGTNLLTFAIQFTFFLGFFIYFYLHGAPMHPNWRIAVLPFLLVEMAALGLGVGCIVSALTTRYHDLSMLVSFGMQLWMYGSCVAYPLSSIPPDVRWIFICNPMVPIIEGIRFAFFGEGTVEIWHLAVGGGVSAVILVVGLALFSHVERTFTDTI